MIHLLPVYGHGRAGDCGSAKDDSIDRPRPEPGRRENDDVKELNRAYCGL